LLAKERQNQILKMLQKEGAVTAAGLVERFEVSMETVRRDLLTMEQNGLLTRVHGGAVTGGEMKLFRDLAHRNQEYHEQKRELARNALQCVSEGDYIAIDAGSTAVAFAEALKERFSRLTVVTYCLDVCEILRDHDQMEVILCGGHYMKGENSFYGELTLEMLDKLHVQKAFVFPSAISLEFGICDYQRDFYMLQKKLMGISDNVYILADSSKFEKKALLKLDEMKPEYGYVTDSGLSAELKKLYQENQITIINGGEES